METERTYFGGACLQNRLYVYGGQNLQYKALCDTETYDCLSDTWISAAPLSVPRRNNAGTVLNGRAMAIGGFDGESILSSVEAYDPRTKNWVSLAPMTTPRSSCMCAVQGDRIIVMGGTKGDRLNTVEWYDGRMNKWASTTCNMMEVRSAGCGSSIYNHIYAIGGTDSGHDVHTSIEVLDPDSLRWHFRANMQCARMDAAAVTMTDSIIVAGGQNTEILGSSEIYRPDLDDWRMGPEMIVPRLGHQLLVSNI
eukprot:GHVO01011191.1.p1 GENE.GHVO01011191.1~~GHVO01011191.1.p1  ORF type:complete len:252 (+),score=36.87 GHVO01011191.1:44-799(+)